MCIHLYGEYGFTYMCTNNTTYLFLAFTDNKPIYYSSISINYTRYSYMHSSSKKLKKKHFSHVTTLYCSAFRNALHYNISLIHFKLKCPSRFQI